MTINVIKTPRLPEDEMLQSTGTGETSAVDKSVKDFLRAIISLLGLSARAYDRILKLAWTVADLEGAADIGLGHVAESIQYRALDCKLRG